jgi:hypothetical protein
MSLFDKSTILKSYYIDALEYHNECIINNFNVPNPIEWLYNECYYRYNYNHLKYTTPKERYNECVFNYNEFMYETYPQGFGNILNMHFNNSNSQVNTSINLLDIFFELKTINDN